MIGTPDSPGILPLSVSDIFKEINKNRLPRYKIFASYLEIYNE